MVLTVGVFIHRDGEKESEYNQQWWLNQLDALIKKAAGDIASHLCPLVCVSVSVCQQERVSTCVYVCVCARKCQWAIRQLVVYAGGHHCASQPPLLTLSESQTVLPWCAHWQSLPPLYSLALSRLTPFVSLYTLHTLAQPFLLYRYYIVDNVIPALSGCPTAPRMTPCLYLCLPHSSSFLMVNGVGSCDMESAWANYRPVFPFEVWYDGTSYSSHICL